MKKVMKGVLFAALLCLCASCKTDKTVYLKAEDPCSFENDGIRISADAHQEYWMYFDPDEYSVDESFFIECDEIPEYCRITSAKVHVESLGISVNKEIGKDIAFDRLKDSSDKVYRGWFSFEGYFYTQDFVDAWNDAYHEKMSSLSLYRKFRDVHDVTITLDVEYAIDGAVYAHQYDFVFEARTVTRSRLWNRMSSV